ncbi:MAG: hypothetical protein B7Z27_07250 [Sphingobacteriia bacterium 32-37-4]|nr:MAG: hypothetical protein B7Z27_07250 [Sphingobacteriia bacterium 32-37-4]
MKPDNMEKKIQTMIADDHPLFVEGLKMILSSNDLLQIAGIANDGKQLLYLLTQQPNIDLILLDVNGIQAAIKIVGGNIHVASLNKLEFEKQLELLHS